MDEERLILGINKNQKPNHECECNNKSHSKPKKHLKFFINEENNIRKRVSILDFYLLNKHKHRK
jgi:hypothetical protein